MRIYIHGNCQASAVGWMLREARPDLVIKSREVHTVDLNSRADLDLYEDDVRGADLILTQPISETYRNVEIFSLKWLRNNKQPHAPLLVFPSIHFRGYNLQSFALDVPGHIMDYHDVHVADMYSSGLSAEACHDRITSPTFFTKAFVLSEVLACLRELVRREEACRADARVSPILSEHLNDELLFHTFNHPARRVLRSVTERLMEAAGDPIQLEVNGVSYLNNVRIMPYHATALHLGLPPAQVPELGEMIRLHVAESLLDYVRAAYASYEQVGPSMVRAKLESHPEAHAYLRRFRQADQWNSESFNPASFIESLFHTLLLRHPTSLEVQYWVDVLPDVGPAHVVQQFTSSPEFQDLPRARVEA
jgi:hypothetical protein